MASKLILTLDGEVVKEYTLDKESLTIGRKSDNDIQLNDLTVSGRHAVITTNNHTTTVKDLGSTNGTLVNGNHVTETSLVHGTVVQIGYHIFTFMMDESEAYEPTMFVRAEIDETKMELPEWEMNSKAIRMRGKPLGGLRKINDPLGNTGIEMRKRFSTVGYRGKKLALINRSDDGYTIVGIQGDNSRRGLDFPMLNGAKISLDQQKLKEHDLISIAGIDMEFYYIH